MRHDTPTDNSPRMALFPGDGFESTLPPEALDELLRRRGRPPSPPVHPPTLFIPFRSAPGVRGIVLALLGLALVVAIIVASTWRQPSQPVSSLAPTIAPAAQPTPALPLGWNADGTAQGRAGTIPEVRRAELVPPVVRRATLMRLPTQQLGVYRFYPVPTEYGGGTVLARFMGTVSRFLDIPKDAQLGDMWNVADGVSTTSWILCRSLQYGTTGVWIDP
jgi:hypothetical protein